MVNEMRTIDEIRSKIPSDVDAVIKRSVVESKLQESIDEMLANPATRQYVQQAKLYLIDSQFQELDGLLKLGYLTGFEGF